MTTRATVLFLASFGICQTALAEAPFQDLTFDAACEVAKKQDKIVLIDFYTTWCGPCKMLDKTTWKDERVRAWLGEKTIALKIDAEKKPKLSARYRVRAYPTIVLAKPDGSQIDSLVGYHPPDKFLAACKDALSGKDSLTRAREKVEAGNLKSPMVRMDYARELARKHKNEQALEEYLWCFDHGGRNDLTFAGVRLSFLLSDIMRLGESYPPAIKALVKRRDKAERRVLKELDPDRAAKPRKKKGFFGRMKSALRSERNVAWETAIDLRALNRTLNEPDRMLAFYDKLPVEGEQVMSVRRLIAQELLDQLLEARRYSDILRDSNTQQEIDFRIRMFRDMDRMRSQYALSANDVTDYKMEVFVLGGKYYEAMVGLGETKKAEALLEQLSQFEESGALYATLLPHADRSGIDSAVVDLMSRARLNLSDEEYDIVSAAHDALSEQ